MSMEEHLKNIQEHQQKQARQRELQEQIEQQIDWDAKRMEMDHTGRADLGPLIDWLPSGTDPTRTDPHQRPPEEDHAWLDAFGRIAGDRHMKPDIIEGVPGRRLTLVPL